MIDERDLRSNASSRMEITSPRNSLLQEIRKAAALGRPTEDGLIVAEGPHLLEEALRGKWKIEQAFVTAGAGRRFSGLIDRVECDVLEVSDRAFSGMASTETTQGLLALMRPVTWSWRDLTRGATLLVVLDGIQDPGNAGTMVRSAEAFNASGVVFLRGSVHVSNGKLLRAASGSMFRIPYLEQLSTSDFLSSLRGTGINLYALSAAGGIEISQASLTGKAALVVGNEGGGISPELSASAIPVSIPIAKVESLNAAVAASIALFEAARQRNQQ